MALMKRISGIRGLSVDSWVRGSIFTTLWYSLRAMHNSFYHNMEKEYSRWSRCSNLWRNGVFTCYSNLAHGFDVIDLGLATTPTTAYMVSSSNAIGGIILTASHNPKHWNALKMLDENGDFVSEEAGKEILRLSDLADFQYATVDGLGKVEVFDEALDRHIEHILSLDLVNPKGIRALDLKIVVDGINSIGAHAVPKLLTP